RILVQLGEALEVVRVVNLRDVAVAVTEMRTRRPVRERVDREVRVVPEEWLVVEVEARRRQDDVPDRAIVALAVLPVTHALCPTPILTTPRRHDVDVGGQHLLEPAPRL